MGKGTNAARREMPVVLKGKKFTVRALDLDAYGEIENFIKAKNARLFRQSAVGMKPKEINIEVMKIIRSSFTPEELAEELKATDCSIFTAYLSIRHNPGITADNYGDVLDRDNISEVRGLLEAVSGDEAEGDDVNPPKADKASP